MSRDYGKLRKRLLVNLDGTGQSEYARKGTGPVGSQTSPAVSNVARIGRATLQEDREFQQIVYYQAGVGSAENLSFIQNAKESGWGSGLVSNVREAYGFICENYDYGDEIYITGFSRGAFTARSVAGLIGKCGLLTKRGLEKFYEAFDYYKSREVDESCPVSEEAGTTRKTYPDGEKKGERIMIRAVGVWDTVGALAGDYGFHDIGLGEHIEHGYHILSLEEKRGYFTPIMWEDPKALREGRLDKFEQCWLTGDHSNIGGSWDDQQLADIALAWMMSRFDALGVKFDDGYLYHEYQKFKDYVKNIGPTLKGGDSGPAYPQALSPRQWGEGRSQQIAAGLIYGRETIRKPKMYNQPVRVPASGFPLYWDPYIKEGKELLRNTNETIHPAVRYRLCCKNQKSLGPRDSGPFNPAALKDWTCPSPQQDGRVGMGQMKPSIPAGPLTWTKSNKSGTLTMEESPMGKYEKMLLAMYDQDRDLPGNIWKQVLGDDGPPKDLKEAVDDIVKANA